MTSDNEKKELAILAKYEKLKDSHSDAYYAAVKTAEDAYTVACQKANADFFRYLYVEGEEKASMERARQIAIFGMKHVDDVAAARKAFRDALDTLDKACDKEIDAL